MINSATKTRLALALSGCLSLGAVLPAAADSAMQQRVELLEKELAALKAELKSGQERQLKKGVEVKKGTRLQYGGYIKLDTLWSDYSDGERANAAVGDDFLVPSVIPVGGGDGANDTVMDTHAKLSRLWLKTHTDTSVGEVMSYFEMDFNSGGTDERLTNQSPNGMRHAFLKWTYEPGSSLLAGQTWSTFFNVGALPEAIDFVGPTSGTLFIRQAQVRWTKALGNGSALMLAAENPSTGLYGGNNGDGASDYDNNDIPDLIARYDAKLGDLSFSVAGMARQIIARDSDIDGEETGLALSVAGKYAFANGDDLKFMLSHGNLGRYIALNAFRDGAIDASGDIALGDVTGGFIAYRHLWNEHWRSTFSYAMSSADNPVAAGTDISETVANASANLIWSPTPSLSFGAEYQFAERELESGVDGDLKRLQLMAKWAF